MSRKTHTPARGTPFDPASTDKHIAHHYDKHSHIQLQFNRSGPPYAVTGHCNESKRQAFTKSTCPAGCKSRA